MQLLPLHRRVLPLAVILFSHYKYGFASFRPLAFLPSSVPASLPPRHHGSTFLLVSPPTLHPPSSHSPPTLLPLFSHPPLTLFPLSSHSSPTLLPLFFHPPPTAPSNLTSPHPQEKNREPELTSVHSWLGVAAISLFCAAYAFGLCMWAYKVGEILWGNEINNMRHQQTSSRVRVYHHACIACAPVPRHLPVLPPSPPLTTPHHRPSLDVITHQIFGPVDRIDLRGVHRALGAPAFFLVSMAVATGIMDQVQYNAVVVRLSDGGQRR